MAALGALWLGASAAAAQSLTLPTIEVVGNTPVPGSEIDRDKVPADVVTATGSQFDRVVTPSLTDGMVRALPGVARGDATGNPYQPNIDYRGFTASPVPGTPQGIAVYQNGTRINEVFGDIVNWDLIPQGAVDRMTLSPSNPVYGLNALGGAVSIEMKNGFNYHGAEGEISGGSFGRIGGSVQAGGRKGNIAGYITADALNDGGWRDFSLSKAQLRRIYFDVGAEGDKGEAHFSFTGADNEFGNVGPTPVEMLNQSWSSVYTWPQTTHNQLAFLQFNGNYKPLDDISLQGNAYYRGFWSGHVDGNTTDAQSCGGGLLCYGDSATPLSDYGGAQLADVYGANLGQIDRTWTSANSFGGSLQFTDTAKLIEHANHFTLGASIDRGLGHFRGTSELGTIDQNLQVNGTGINIQSAAADLSPVTLASRSTYTGIYVSDTFDVTSKLSVTGGLRFNDAHIVLDDQLGTALNSDNHYAHLNPMVGVTYKIAPALAAYGSYSQADRAPTPLELGCADPNRPCLIDNFLISDPPLKQVVSTTYEAGLRGSFEVGGKLEWHAGVYRTTNRDDIVNVASQINGFGYFLNAAETRRQGFEAGMKLSKGPLKLYANYTYVDATFQSALTLPSPNNPAADSNGNIHVSPGDHIPAIPNQRLKAGFDYNVTEPWLVGADLDVIGSQYFIGDQSNQNPKVPAYWVVNLHSAYKIDKHVEVFGLVQNLFNQHYYASGAFFDTGAIASRPFGDPRAYVPGMPLAVYVGVRGTF
ncbi:MAG TPA: TonB-dependent receptor [Pseudolabrys sp.]|nr:TonB-dependent receptor [Pseudolabrys sp.]